MLMISLGVLVLNMSCHRVVRSGTEHTLLLLVEKRCAGCETPPTSCNAHVHSSSKTHQV